MLLRDNPQPTPARPPRPSSANAAREEQQQAWELLAQEALDEDAYLKELAGVTDLAQATSLQVVIDTSKSTVSHFGSKLPNLCELSLNNSVLDCLRDLGTGFTQLRVLWISRCGVASLDGASGLPALRELYAAFNDVSDLQALDACGELEVLDLEGNCISDPDMVHTLAPLTNLYALTLVGNPISHSPSYRHHMATSLITLRTLDDAAVRDADRQLPAGTAAASSSFPGQQGSGAGCGPQAVGGTEQSQQQSQLQVLDNTGREGSCEGIPLSPAGRSPLHVASDLLSAHKAADEAASERAATASPRELNEGVGRYGEGSGTELDMVHEGIKRARVGMDSHEFREMEMAVLLDGQAEAATAGTRSSVCSTGAPPSSASSDATTHSALASTQRLPRPSSASPLMPFSAGSWIRTLRASQASSCSTSGGILNGSLCEGLASHHQGQQPQSNGIIAQGRTTSSRPASAAHTHLQHSPGGRSMSAASACPFSARIGTAGVGGREGGAGRQLGTGTSAPPTADGGLYWRKHRLQAAQYEVGGILDGKTHTGRYSGAPNTPPDCEDDDVAGAASASALTLGGSAIGGSMARDLRRRRKAAAGLRLHGGSCLHSSMAIGQQGRLGLRLGNHDARSSGVYNTEALLQELRKWKLETADRALLPEEGPSEEAWGNAEGPVHDQGILHPSQCGSQQGECSAGRSSGKTASGADILDLGCEEADDGGVSSGSGLQGQGERWGHSRGGRQPSCLPCPSNYSHRSIGEAGKVFQGPDSNAHSSSSRHSAAYATEVGLHRSTSSVHSSRPQSNNSQGGGSTAEVRAQRPNSSSHSSRPQSSVSHRTATANDATKTVLQRSVSGAESSSSSRPQSNLQHRTVLAKVIRDVGGLGSQPHQHRHQDNADLHQEPPPTTVSDQPSSKPPFYAGEIDISSANPRPTRRLDCSD